MERADEKRFGIDEGRKLGGMDTLTHVCVSVGIGDSVLTGIKSLPISPRLHHLGWRAIYL
jgi:hypothetical protein